MKIGLISDIHCNVAGLYKALASLECAEKLLCAGDAIYQYRFSNEVLALIRCRGIQMVMGDHEHAFLNQSWPKLRTDLAVEEESITFLRSLPLTLETIVGSKKIMMVHGAPWSPLGEYLYPSSRAFSKLGALDADIVILGHTHIPFVERVGKTLVVNPGSCVESRNPKDWDYGTCALLETDTEEVSILRFKNL